MTGPDWTPLIIAAATAVGAFWVILIIFLKLLKMEVKKHARMSL